MKKELVMLCDMVKNEINGCDFGGAMDRIRDSMRDYPDSPVPHNLMGILMEMEGEHGMGMKHFRASYALDPTFIPTRVNMDLFASFSRDRGCAYTEEDCLEEIKKENAHKYKLNVDEKGIGFLEVVK